LDGHGRGAGSRTRALDLRHEFVGKLVGAHDGAQTCPEEREEPAALETLRETVEIGLRDEVADEVCVCVARDTRLGEQQAELELGRRESDLAH
jgi:hypothetical protein